MMSWTVCWPRGPEIRFSVLCRGDDLFLKHVVFVLVCVLIREMCCCRVREGENEEWSQF